MARNNRIIDKPRWEYYFFFLALTSGMDIQDAFNELGKHRWELVAVSERVAFFKRPKGG